MTKEIALKTDSNILSERVNELSKLLNMNIDWDSNYDEYCMITSILCQRYREENIEEFEKFFFKNIYAKEWDEIDSDILDKYSDWHKDMFGYRPRSTDKDW